MKTIKTIKTSTTQLSHCFLINKDTAIVNWDKIKKVFTQSIDEPCHYEYVSFLGHSYTITSNSVRITFSEDSLNDIANGSHYSSLVSALEFLFLNGALKTVGDDSITDRDASKNIIDNYGLITHTQALDVYGVLSSPLIEFHTIGVRTQHKEFARFSIITTKSADGVNTERLIDRPDKNALLAKQVINLYENTDKLELSEIIGRFIGKSKQHNYRKIRQWLEGKL